MQTPSSSKGMMLPVTLCPTKGGACVWVPREIRRITVLKGIVIMVGRTYKKGVWFDDTVKSPILLIKFLLPLNLHRITC